MTPEKEKKPSRAEVEVGYYTKELGRRRQRKLLRRRVEDVCDSSITAASHAEEPSWEHYDPPPPEDRAG
jgi:hypothetical protein